jgi:4'-phosphopantetheinyl transferase
LIATLFATSATAALRAGDVHVWRFACAQDPGALAAALSHDERSAAARFTATAHRDAYIAQHAMVRWLLARYVDVAPGALVFERGPRGKPAVAGVHHNLAHAEDVALLAVARDVEVGVDIERYDAAIDPVKLAPLVLAPAEAQCTSRRAFLRVWCRKEACLKATGVGLLDDLTSVAVLRERVDVASAIVYVQDLVVGAEHAAALATSMPRPGLLELETVSS